MFGAIFISRKRILDREAEIMETLREVVN